MNRRQMMLAGAGLPLLHVAKLNAFAVPQVSPSIASAANSALVALLNQAKQSKSGITTALETAAHNQLYALFNNMASVGMTPYIQSLMTTSYLNAQPWLTSNNASQLSAMSRAVGANVQPSDYDYVVVNPGESIKPGIITYLTTTTQVQMQASILSGITVYGQWGILSDADEERHHEVRSLCDYAGIIGDALAVLAAILIDTPLAIPLALLAALFLFAKDVIC